MFNTYPITLIITMLGYSRNAGVRNKSFSKRLNNLGSIIKSIGNYGIVINKKVLDNKQAIPEDPRLEGDIYSLIDPVNNMGRGSQNSTNPQFNQSDQILRQARRWNLILASKNPELEDVIETLASETIVYDNNGTYCCTARLNTLMLDEDIINEKDTETLEDLINKKFPTLYRMLGFYKSGAKNLMQEWLVEGKKAWEIVYDSLENPKSIIGLVPIDPLSLIEYWDDEGNRWYIQEPNLTQQTNQFGNRGSNHQQRTLHDSQVIYWDWDASGFKFSYMERLLRAFNIYRSIERMKINWWVMNSQYRMQMIIPTHGKSRQKAAETLSAAMQRYRDHVEFNDDDGTVRVNGSVNIPANKEYWLADTTSGKPDISQVGGEGYDLSSSDTSTFKRNFLELTKMPIDRFDPSSSDSWNIDPQSQTRQELKFAKFVQSLRTSMSEIILKPLIIQLCLDKPQLTKEYDLLDAITIDFFSENIFSQKIEMEVMNEKADFIGNMLEKLKRTDADGNEKPFFALSFLIEKYEFLTPEEMERNAKALKKEDEAMMKFTIEQNKIRADYERQVNEIKDDAKEAKSDAAEADKVNADFANNEIKMTKEDKTLYESIKSRKLSKRQNNISQYRIS